MCEFLAYTLEYTKHCYHISLHIHSEALYQLSYAGICPPVGGLNFVCTTGEYCI